MSNYCHSSLELPSSRPTHRPMSSTIGDTLYSIYSSTTVGSIDDNVDQAQVYVELGEYWRGVVEFSATFLRSGFMAVGSFLDDIPSNLSSQVNWTTMYISMIGWTIQSPTYLVAILPLTIITILTFTRVFIHYCAGFDVRSPQVRLRRVNTLHLVMVSAAGSLSLKLAGFNEQGTLANVTEGTCGSPPVRVRSQ